MTVGPALRINATRPKTRTFVLVLGALALSATGAPNLANAYRFFGLPGRVLSSARPERLQLQNQWDPVVWGPGETLPVAVVEDPRWLAGFRDFRELRDTASAALADWSSIETADIRWEVRDPDDSPITISIDEHRGATGYASIRYRTTEKGSLIEGCHIIRTSLGFDRQDADPYMRNFIRHELGHCLGLHHSNPYPSDYFQGTMFGDEDNYRVSLWRDDTAVLSLDARIGASLLRPTPGWVETTGRIIGTVLAENGDPARYVSVLATRRNHEGIMTGGVKRFTDSYGQFAIDGLQPGTYFLYIYPIEAYTNLHGELPNATVEIRHTARLTPITVRAGHTTPPEVVTVRVLRDLLP